MKTANLFLVTSLCSVALLTSGCTMCHIQPRHHGYHEQYSPDKPHKKQKQKHRQKAPETAVFYQTYGPDNMGAVNANIYTRSAKGGESEMGVIQFQETNDGLKMNVDLVDLRPGKSYTALVYQCFECNDSTCCSEEAMSVDLPKIKTNTSGRLQESYIIRGLTATQLNNAKIVLTRDGGYKAAWGTLLN